MKIKELREKKRLTQKELAEILSVDQRLICYYESPKLKGIPFEKLKQIANYFEVSVDYLIENKTNTLDTGLFSQEQLDIINIIKCLSDEECKRLKDFALGMKSNNNNINLSNINNTNITNSFNNKK